MLRESQASPQIMAQQLWNTLNREKDSWGTPAWGCVSFYPSDSVAEALTTHRCSGWSPVQHMALCDPPTPTYTEQLP